MKRLRIWLSNFTLIQQFLTIVFFTGAFLLFFVFTFLNRNIDAFVNSQMYVFIHRSQNEYLETRSFSSESNVLHFVYNTQSGRYLNSVSDQYELILRQIDPDPEGGKIDSSFESGNMTIVYSIISFGDNNENRLISIVKNNFRDEFRSALSNSIINITFYVFFALIGLIVIWVFSLIRPLDQIISYINKIKAGEKATLNVNRYDEIGEVAEALVSMNQELSEQQHIRDEMIQNISHDLKTPIATIKSYSESIKDGIYPYDTLEKSVDVIIENADRLEKKVYSLITYNKMGYLVDNNEGILNLEMAPLIQKPSWLLRSSAMTLRSSRNLMKRSCSMAMRNLGAWSSKTFWTTPCATPNTRSSSLWRIISWKSITTAKTSKATVWINYSNLMRRAIRASSALAFPSSRRSLRLMATISPVKTSMTVLSFVSILPAR